MQGFAVQETGWTRSNLMSKTIEAAKIGNSLDRITFSLLYATDFADRFENEILPALEAGFIVLADRYIYTAFARDWMRGKDRQWIEDVLGFALIPDLTLYLKTDLEHLIPRVLENGNMNYWESGWDLKLGEDLFDSFKQYQNLMIQEFDHMAKRFNFEIIDARSSIDKIQQELRKKISPLLANIQNNPIQPLLPTKNKKPSRVMD